MADPVLEPGVLGLLTQHALNGAQGQADDSRHFASATRYDYLTTKNQLSFAAAIGIRHVEESGSGRTRNIDNTIAGQQASGK